MACTTILVGKDASYDGSTIIARNDDCPSGEFHVKKMVVITPDKQLRHYKSVISHVEIDLPDNPLSYTLMPSVDTSKGIWGASGINSENVAMTATETITSNNLVLGADPYVEYHKEGDKEVVGGIGEEDLVYLVLPYIHSAREGVLRLGSLLEKFGTYEPNGIAFSDKDEIWWLETIGGHNFMARRVPDNRYVVMPNQLGIDEFDFADALGKQKNYICSKGLKDLVEEYHLNLNNDGDFNPRLAFGSHDDSDHVYNTPRAWFMAKYLNPHKIDNKIVKWIGDDATYTPESDDIPWSFVPERKITVDDVKYILSSHYQGTEYDPYNKHADPLKKNMYRSIGINRTSFLSINQIRGYLPKEIQAIEWICYGSNVFNAIAPVYTNTSTIPEYYSNTTLEVSTDNFYWSSRLIGALADSCFNTSAIHIERYQGAVGSQSYELVNKYDKKIAKTIKDKKDYHALIDEANNKIATMVKKETATTLNKVLYAASMNMKNSFSRSDN